ncbi:MAG TPA: TldD/PmbA family protein [Frankiaceae bacterium]|nr:TldD/PmbA family protein [Frankiaceae bacterium]
MFDLAQAAVEAALAAGARFADARVVVSRDQRLRAQDGVLEDLSQGESAGLGVRALIGAGWGHAATPALTSADVRRAGEHAAGAARAAASVPGPEAVLLPEPPVVGEWENGYDEDPMAVPLDEKATLLTDATAAMKAAGADIATAAMAIWDVETWLVSSEGTRIHQRVRKCGAGMSATAIGERETQRRSHPSAFGHYGTCGYELIRSFDLPGNAERIASEARALLTAPECPAVTTDLILGSEQMALQIHESVGHAVELDRILGWEAAFAGTSWLDLGKLGSLRYGSDLMTITADATLPGGLGSFGYDDEGTPARPVDIVRDGIWVGVLSGRDSAARAGLSRSGAAVRADGWSRMPMVRMTNVGLLPGTSSLEEIIADTADGIYMENNRSWSIDDRRLNFQFGCEIGYEIKNGKRGRMLRNPSYTGIGPVFWSSLDALAGPEEMVVWGTPNCGKGQPLQIGHTGHPAVPGRFRGVRVGVRG